MPHGNKIGPMPARLSMPLLLAAALLGACGEKQPTRDTGAAVSGTPATANNAATLAAAGDGNWVNISGRVVSTAPDRFVLDYGRGNVTVEMDDWDWYQEGRAIKPGDEVTVNGRADANLFARKTIEARSVHVKGLNTFFYANASDEETPVVTTVYVPPSPGGIDAKGRVSAIQGREFTLAWANGSVRVDTSTMAENPLDNQGFQQVKVGDELYVWGDLDLEKGENAELMASTIVTLNQDAGKTRAGTGGGTAIASQTEPATS